jgi:hypothetical protein
MLYLVEGTVYYTPCLPYRALQVCWTRTLSLRRG